MTLHIPRTDHNKLLRECHQMLMELTNRAPRQEYYCDTCDQQWYWDHECKA